MKQDIKVKVCGMKFTENRKAVESLPVDFLGYIFYPASGRFAGNADAGLFRSSKTKVAVFVDETIPGVLETATNHGFRFVQLHGTESPETCRALKEHGLIVIKAFNVDENFQFSSLSEYENSSDYFLFDTKTGLPGGSGKKFNWKVLEKYKGHTPFFLSGGIQPDDAEKILQFSHPQLFGIDLNSGFENEPGLKNIEKLRNFIQNIKAG